MKLMRCNSRGIYYTISAEVNKDKCIVELNGTDEVLIFNCSQKELAQKWFQIMVNKDNLLLSDKERAFLMR